MFADFFIKLPLLLLTSFFFLSGIFSIKGINPNIPLVFFILFFTTYSKKNKFLLFSLLVFLFLIFVYFLGGTFFIKETLFFIVILFILFFLEKVLSGYWYLDGLILVLIYNILFYGGMYIIFFSPFLGYKIIGEIIYDYFLIILLSFLLKNKK